MNRFILAALISCAFGAAAGMGACGSSDNVTSGTTAGLPDVHARSRKDDRNDVQAGDDDEARARRWHGRGRRRRGTFQIYDTTSIALLGTLALPQPGTQPDLSKDDSTLVWVTPAAGTIDKSGDHHFKRGSLFTGAFNAGANTPTGAAEISPRARTTTTIRRSRRTARSSSSTTRPRHGQRHRERRLLLQPKRAREAHSQPRGRGGNADRSR
jgi:hypothetical protein